MDFSRLLFLDSKISVLSSSNLYTYTLQYNYDYISAVKTEHWNFFATDISD